MNDTAAPADVQDFAHLAQAYHAHHFQCPQCIAAGLGYGQRCQAGALLWTAYQEAS